MHYQVKWLSPHSFFSTWVNLIHINHIFRLQSERVFKQPVVSAAARCANVTAAPQSDFCSGLATLTLSCTLSVIQILLSYGCLWRAASRMFPSSISNKQWESFLWVNIWRAISKRSGGHCFILRPSACARWLKWVPQVSDGTQFSAFSSFLPSKTQTSSQWHCCSYGVNTMITFLPRKKD